ncbi:glycosyltransferase [Streptomyces sp. NPDC048603]|uniref:glycosyltransferase n=1 Tax=Streptomyces sp. NPDC048603 TaxID=3365577 RepID=UPI00371331A9
MRVLCTATGSPSDAGAMLPLVSAFAAAGHEVLVASTPALRSVFSGAPVRTAGLLADPEQDLSAGLADASGGRRKSRTRGPAGVGPAAAPFAGAHLSDSCAALLPAARDFDPHLVVRDGAEFAGCLVAEALGLPHVSAPSGAANHLDPRTVHPALNAHRVRLGLPVRTDPWAVHRYGRLDCMPPQYSFAAPAPVPTPLLTYRQPCETGPDGRVPPWMAELPTDRPLVIAAPGTVPPAAGGRSGGRGRSGGGGGSGADGRFDDGGLLGAVVTGLSAVDCVAVVATGGTEVPAAAAHARADGIHLVDRVPRPLLLRCARLFVTHGEYDGIREAVAAGVPMAVIPRSGDQPANADRVQALGLGRRICGPAGPDGGPGGPPSPDAIATVCRQLLADRRVDAEARRARLRMLTLPPVESAVARLERLALGAVPAVRRVREQ